MQDYKTLGFLGHTSLQCRMEIFITWSGRYFWEFKWSLCTGVHHNLGLPNQRN